MKALSDRLIRLFIFLFPAVQIPGNQVIAQDSIPNSRVIERIHVIQTMLNDGKKNANLWWYGWLYGYSAATVAQGTVAVFAGKLSTRQDMILGAATTFLGAAFQLVTPMVPGYAPKRLQEMPEGTPEENRLKLEEAEKLLEASARRERDGRSWKIHVLDGLVNVSSGFIVWFGFDRNFGQGFVNASYNQAICEAQIFTQPTRAIRDYNVYCLKYKPGQSLTLKPPPVSWYFTMIPGGLGLRLVF